MKPASFELVKPRNLADALAALAQHGAGAKLIAGGQSLVPSMNFRLARPEVLIDINGLAELQGVEDAGDRLVIGAVTRHAAFHSPVCSGPTGRMLADVVGNIAHYPIRQRGTFGGSLSHADPASEWCLTATTMGAEMEVHGPDGTRRVAARDFFRGTFMTAIDPEDLLVSIHLPKLAAGWGTGFCEFSRRKGDFALAMSLCALRLDGGRVAEARVGVGAVAAKALRLEQVEATLTGAPATPETLAGAAAKVAELIDPPGDIHGSADYRRDLAVTMVRRALQAALADADVAEIAA